MIRYIYGKLSPLIPVEALQVVKVVMTLAAHRHQVVKRILIAESFIRQVMHLGGGLFADYTQAGVNLQAFGTFRFPCG